MNDLEFKKGDCVVLVSNHEFFSVYIGVYPIIERTHDSVLLPLFGPAKVCLKSIRRATPAEITAGHRIDESTVKNSGYKTALIEAKKAIAELPEWRQEALRHSESLVLNPPENTPEPLVDMASSVGHKDAVREAFEKLCFNNTPESLNFDTALNELGDYRSDRTDGGWQVYQARQAEVDLLKDELLAQDKRMMRTFALVQQWRDEAVSPRLGFEPDITGTLESCADELEKALGGGV